MRTLLVTALLALGLALTATEAHAQSGRLVGRVQRQEPPAPRGAPLGDVLTMRRHGSWRVTETGIVLGGGLGVELGGSRLHHPAAYYYPVDRTHIVYVESGSAVPYAYAPRGYGVPTGEWRPFAPRARAPDESCALVAVLEAQNRGYWQELALPAGGARTRDELQRFLNALLAEGLPFRVRDAAGETLYVASVSHVERIVVHACS